MAFRLSRLTFRPRLWPTLLTLPVLAALLALGFWQLDRLAWKEALIAELEERREAAPISLSSALEAPQENEYRSVSLQGNYLHDGEIHWLARTHESKSGYHVLTPLRLTDGREILVDRGWMPGTDPEANSAEVSRPEGRQELTAVLRRGGWGGPGWLSNFLRPENRPAENEWLWPDLPAMADAAGMENPVTEAYVTLLPESAPSGLPLAQAPPINLKNDHLGYAITWFTLAGALAVIYLLFHLRPRPGPPSRPDGPRPSGRHAE
ncbi:SURF1 family protein [Fodinicurvata fenggangensis]|uniref:SURF1 family protein n=1 Tax=Fodinicurvata fenggangensis TaxID=1121830 RepID=UPI001FE1406D|nr:SURF1 family protein [Fodinicurvata fenggangensis]